jgi:lysophospholipase L1-like esterase
VINKQPANNTPWIRTVPGVQTFAEAVNNKRNKKAALFSDSICNRFSVWEMNQKSKTCTISKKSFPGATSLDLNNHYMLPHLKQNVPDIAIIHAGVNDILKLHGDSEGGLKSSEIDIICNNIIQCGHVCKQYGVDNVCISSLLPGKYTKFQASVIFINHKLDSMCRDVGFDFFRNDNIIYVKPTPGNDGLFYKDGLHLNAAGRQILMNNFIDYLDNNH